MIYEIENKHIKVILKNEHMKLPLDLKKKIEENFETVKKRLKTSFCLQH